MVSLGSSDAVIFEHIAVGTLSALRFARDYWGVEALAAYVFSREGYLVHNMSPQYCGYHIHDASNVPKGFREGRPAHRIRVDSDANRLNPPAGKATESCTFSYDTNFWSDQRAIMEKLAKPVINSTGVR